MRVAASSGYPFSTKPTDTERNQTKPSGQNVTTPMLFSGHGLEGQVQVLVNGYAYFETTDHVTTIINY